MPQLKAHSTMSGPARSLFVISIALEWALDVSLLKGGEDVDGCRRACVRERVGEWEDACIRALSR